MSSLRSIWLPAFAVCSALWVAPLAIGQQEFRWKFTEGAAWDALMTQELVNESNGKTTQSSQELTLRWTIKNVLEDGTAEIEQSARRLVFRMGDRVIIDAEQSDADNGDSPAASRLRTLLKVRFVTQTSPRGRTLQLRFEPEVLEQLRDQLGLDEATIRQTFSQESLVFPEAPLDVGSTWTAKSQTPVPGFGMVKTFTTFQYVGPETLEGRQVDKFKVSPSFQLEDADRSMSRQEGSGTIWFDRELGRIARAESLQEFELNKDNAGKPMAQKNTVKTTFRFSEPSQE
jgi:hypothetical protein